MIPLMIKTINHKQAAKKSPTMIARTLFLKCFHTRGTVKSGKINIRKYSNSEISIFELFSREVFWDKILVF